MQDLNQVLAEYLLALWSGDRKKVAKILKQYKNNTEFKKSVRGLTQFVLKLQEAFEAVAKESSVYLPYHHPLKKRLKK